VVQTRNTSLSLPFSGTETILKYAQLGASMEKSIRVLVANRPRLMRELILSTLADQPDIEIAGEVTDDEQIPDRVSQTQPNLVVIALDEPGKRPAICDTILRQHPEIRVLAVASKENQSICYWASFDIHSDHVESSEAGFLSAVRNMAAGLNEVS
jgi:DNA-binding NarL/FixJ family response regulator